MDVRDVRPRSVGEVVDAGLSLYRRRFGTATLLSAFFVVPTALVQLWSVRNAEGTGLGDVLASAFELATIAEPPPLSWLGVSLDLLGTLLALAASVALFVPVYRGREPGARATLTATFRRVVPTLIIALAVLVGGTVGLVLLVFPGLWLVGSWSLALPAMVDEGIGARAALNRSFGLVRGRFFTILAILGLVFLIQAMLTYVGVLATLAAEWMTSFNPSFLITDALVNAVGSLFGIPILAGVLTAAYFDARIRREGLDLELAAAALEGVHSKGHPIENNRDVFGLGAP